MNTYYKILNEIASIFDMDQWDEQVNTFTDVIETQLNYFVHNAENECIYILENSFSHNFPQFDFYKERCYVNGEKVKLDSWGATENKWKDQETVKVIIKDLDQLGKSCKYMFFKCYSLVLVPLFDTSKVTNMNHMFRGCESLKTVPKFDTSRVTNMNSMFYGCESLESVPLFNISSVTNIDDMFYTCRSLSEKTKQAWSSVYNFRTNEMKNEYLLQNIKRNCIYIRHGSVG